MIRPMEISDLPTITHIFKQANPKTTAEAIHKYTLPVLQEFPQFCWIVVHSEGTKIVGGITGIIQKDRSAGYIMDIAVESSYHHQNFGHLLMARELKVFDEANVSSVELEIHYLNAKVIPFYYRYGFRLQKIKKDEYGSGQDAIEMNKTFKVN
ncbi:GNAT family N-acetyltransferase [Candidatus Lokiarchaeum ossiferum]|uniref:GNAT family N-acetyltransferase n=1 Tax=Candidatus Lokiarchaeum ossiferum TaxID=2951803 RepID=UPI00352EDCEA